MVSNHNHSNHQNQPSPPSLFQHADDAMLSNSELLTAEETIRRRHRHIINLLGVYKDYYWDFASQLRNKHREYLWNFGTPFDQRAEDDEFGGIGFQNGEEKLDQDEMEFNKVCAFSVCSKKPMAMTKYCHSHILSDPKQMLYKGCAFVTSRSGSEVQTLCAKPILRSTTPFFCKYHLIRAKKTVARSLKQAGLSTNDSNRMAPLIHIIGAEFVNEILRKRRAAKESKTNADKMGKGVK